MNLYRLNNHIRISYLDPGSVPVIYKVELELKPKPTGFTKLEPEPTHSRPVSNRSWNQKPDTCSLGFGSIILFCIYIQNRI